MPSTAPALVVPQSLTDLPRLLAAAEGFADLTAALKAGHSGAIDGAWGSAAALAVAALRRETSAPILVVLAHPGDLDAWAADLTGFTGEGPAVFPVAEGAADNFFRAADETTAARFRLVQQLRGPQPPKLLLAAMAALQQAVPTPAALDARCRTIRVGDAVSPDELAEWLVERGYKRVDAVERAGELSRRGGIFDLYSPDAENPVRLEFFGDEIESLRAFSAQTQRRLGDLSSITVLGMTPARGASEGGIHPSLALRAGHGESGHLTDYLPPDAWVLLVEPEELREQGQLFLERQAELRGLFTVEGATALLLKFPSVTVSALPTASVEATCHLRVESVERFSGNVTNLRDELDGIAASEQVLIACATEAERHRLGEVLATGKLAASDRLRLVHGRVRAGFRLVEAGLAVLGSHELFHRDPTPDVTAPDNRSVPKRQIEARAIDSFLELRDGDYVVHVSHGIARFRGMHLLPKGAAATASSRPLVEVGGSAPETLEEHLILEFRDGVFMYVPASKIDLVQKYVGGGRSDPELSKVGGTSWQRRKDKVEEAVRDLAADMLELQAVRESQAGFAYPADSDWQIEFEAAFPYRETPDQLTALAEIKADMQKPRSMDRLVCGDVGYGKTEMALRAAFKAIDNGKQVAVLVPTTILAEQHYRTFRDRFAAYPFVVEVVSRFRSPGEQKRILKRVAEGGVDVIVGTHRLVSADVRFHDLGLVVIDEEQRFGVEHKERLKRLRATVDVLTLTATPIPRTLHLALLGIRDISNLETPPPDRLPIETRIARFDPQLIRHAILRELNRDGQVYFVHNRVQTIHEVAHRVQEIVPEARIVVAHGQMSADELEQAMVRFVRREADILVATTIIESGLDIPNANTMFIHQADIYGLADLHQLRGRVGRHKHRAYAYLLLDGDKQVTGQAARRLKAIEEFTELGSGFKIALRDLEIRGAGNLLGTQQSGHIAAVGYELYCQLLENAVRAMKKQPLKTPIEVNVDLPWPAYLPRDYVPGQKLRIEVYRRLARVRELRKLADFEQELRDRYGPPPEPAVWLLKVAGLRVRASRWQISSLHRDGPDLVLSYRNVRLANELAARSGGRLKVVDEKSLYYRLEPGEDEPQTLYETVLGLVRLRDESTSLRSG